MRKDKRAPVLYLRPFEAETVLTVQERVLARIMESEVGPLVAVGNPGDRLPHLGAARFYERDFSGDGRNWQLFVREMLLRARLVLIVPGRTVGLAWEIAQCREVLAPQRLVVLMRGSPRHRGTGGPHAAADQHKRLRLERGERCCRPHYIWLGLECELRRVSPAVTV
jgi:hypothetical protein